MILKIITGNLILIASRILISGCGQASKDITFTSINNQILVVAKEHILITAGGGYIKIHGGNIEVHAPGKVSLKGSNVAITGPTSMNAVPPKPPISEMKLCEFKTASATSSGAGIVPLN